MNKEELFLTNFSRLFELRHTLSKLNKKEYSLDYYYTEIRCLRLVSTIEEANVTKISEVLYMTRGGVSKLIKKLIGQGVIESYQKQTNKKEIYFKLTNEGKQVIGKYSLITQAQGERDKDVFNELSEEEKDVIIKFLQKFNNQLKEDMDKIKFLNNEEELI